MVFGPTYEVKIFFSGAYVKIRFLACLVFERNIVENFLIAKHPRAQDEFIDV